MKNVHPQKSNNLYKMYQNSVLSEVLEKNMAFLANLIDQYYIFQVMF